VRGGPILLVDDDPDDIELARRAFARTKVPNPIEVVTDGEEALERLIGPRAGAMPALVLLDLKLPRVDGLEVLQQLRADERTAFLPIVILTSSREERDMIEGYRLGANSYVRKPVDFTMFEEAIRQIGTYWLILNESPTTR
jgi:two-component system response regulator